MNIWCGVNIIIEKISVCVVKIYFKRYTRPKTCIKMFIQGSKI